jgi:hypothetical protein
MTAARIPLGARTARAVAAVLLLGAAAQLLSAQTTASVTGRAQPAAQRAGSLLIGSVLVADSGSTPISGAEVIVQELGLRAQTGRLGTTC